MRTVYWGESHRSWWDRSQEHLVALDSGNKEYATVKHMLNKHQGDPHDFKFKVDRCWRSSLQRQIMESIRIDNED